MRKKVIILYLALRLEAQIYKKNFTLFLRKVDRQYKNFRDYYKESCVFFFVSQISNSDHWFIIWTTLRWRKEASETLSCTFAAFDILKFTKTKNKFFFGIMSPVADLGMARADAPPPLHGFDPLPTQRVPPSYCFEISIWGCNLD